MKERRCGFVAIVGRPNVGKSSLLNALLDQKVSITSFKPQTTRQSIMGIKTQDNVQVVYVDTPGIHLGAKKALNKQMNKSAKHALIDVDAIIFVVEALKWTAEDNYVCENIAKKKAPILVAINKVDLVAQKEELLPFVEKIAEKLPTAKIVPVSVKKGIQLETIEQWVDAQLPESEFYFPPEQTVNHSERFYIAEIIREKLMFLLKNELPYSLCVEIEKLEEEEKLKRIEACIWVERESQKAIVIGEKGHMLREVGTRARKELEVFYNKKVFLKLWVKVKESWSDDIRAIKSLGYED